MVAVAGTRRKRSTKKEPRVASTAALAKSRTCGFGLDFTKSATRSDGGPGRAGVDTAMPL